MKENPSLDKHIKTVFRNYQPDVPAHLWENIIAGKKRDRWGGFLLFFNKPKLFLLLALVLTGIIYFFYNSQSVGNSSATKQAPVENAPMFNPPLANQNEIVEKSNSQVQQANEKVISFTGNQIKLTQSAKAINVGRDNVTTGPGDEQSAKSGLKTFKASTSMKYINGETGVDESLITTEPNDVVSIKSIQQLQIKILQLSLLKTEILSAKTITKIMIPELNIPCPGSEKNAAGNKKYIEVYIGPDYSFRSLTDTGNSAYLEKRKQSSRFSSAFSAGFRYTRVFGNGMSFRTGINYSQINEKFKYAQGNVIQVNYITNSNGDTTGSFTTTGTRYKTTHNKFRTADLPLLIGYELGNGKWHANFNTGPVINLYSWQKGDVLDTAFNPVNITTGKASSPYQFRTNVGVGFLAGVSIYYALSNKLHLLAEPYFRYNFVPASKSELTLKQKYNTAGLRIGIRLDID